MNEVILVGRMSRDPNIKTGGNVQYVRFGVAVDRMGEKKVADFPQCIAFGKTAEVIDKYGFKGQKIAVSGRIQTGKYQKQNGDTVYTTDVVVNRVEFLEWADRQEQAQPEQTLEPDVPESFESIDEDVPF